MKRSKGLIRLLLAFLLTLTHIFVNTQVKNAGSKNNTPIFQKDNWPPLALIYGTAFSTYSLIESLLSLTCNQFFIFVKSLPVCLRLAEPKTTTV